MLSSSNKVKDIYKAIHIDKSYKEPIYEKSSGRVAEAYDFEEMMDWTPFYDKSLDKKMKLIVYAGEYDQRDGPLTQIDWMKDSVMLDKSGGNFWE